MGQTIVLVTFYSRSGSTEKLATAAAVGAVQARAGIRMRRVADLDASATVERFPESKAHLPRMRKEYVVPREADILASHALILGSPEDLTPASAEWAPLFDMLARLHSDGKLLGKVGAAVGSGMSAFGSALGQLGFTTVPPAALSLATTGDGAVDGAVMLGRQVVALAETFSTGRAREGTA